MYVAAEGLPCGNTVSAKTATAMTDQRDAGRVIDLVLARDLVLVEREPVRVSTGGLCQRRRQRRGVLSWHGSIVGKAGLLRLLCMAGEVEWPIQRVNRGARDRVVATARYRCRRAVTAVDCRDK